MSKTTVNLITRLFGSKTQAPPSDKLRTKPVPVPTSIRWDKGYPPRDRPRTKPRAEPTITLDGPPTV